MIVSEPLSTPSRNLVHRLAYNGDVVAFKMDRLEKQPTDLRRRHHYMRDGALAHANTIFVH